MMGTNLKKGALLQYLAAIPLVCLIALVSTNPQVQTNVNETLAMTSNLDYFTNLDTEKNTATTTPLEATGDKFNKRKAKAKLKAAFEGLAAGYRDKILTLHKTALELMEKHPNKQARIRNLTKIVAAENDYALRFHENGESIIYRELTAKEVAQELARLEAIEEVLMNEATPAIVKTPVVVPTQELQLKAFPNPTAERLTISFSGSAIPTIVSIVDLSGKEIYRTELTAFNGNYMETIPLGEQVRGMVTVHVTQEGQNVQQKIFVIQ